MKKIILPAIIVGILAAGFWYWKTNVSTKEQAATEDAHHHDHDAAKLKDSENQKTLDEIMAVHDEVMPKMSIVTELHKKFSDMAAATKDKALKNKLLDVVMALNKADEGMFEWMEKFPEDVTKIPESEVKGILATEKTKVDAMKNQVLSAIQLAEDFMLNQKK
jgi:hypothetical protein